MPYVSKMKPNIFMKFRRHWDKYFVLLSVWWRKFPWCSPSHYMSFYITQQKHQLQTHMVTKLSLRLPWSSSSMEILNIFLSIFIINISRVFFTLFFPIIIIWLLFLFLFRDFVVRLNEVQLQTTILSACMQKLLATNSYLFQNKSAVLPVRLETNPGLTTVAQTRNRWRKSSFPTCCCSPRSLDVFTANQVWAGRRVS